MLVKKLGVNALLPTLCRLRFSKSFHSNNHIYCDLNNSTLDFLSSFIKIVFKLLKLLVGIVQLLYDVIHEVDY